MSVEMPVEKTSNTENAKKKWVTPELEDISISVSTLGKPLVDTIEFPSYAPS